MQITAQFSDGSTDTYKGKRPVKAAWAIFSLETGALLRSGHSLDRAKAQKTAETNVTYCPGLGAGGLVGVPRTRMHMGALQYYATVARKLGAPDKSDFLKWLRDRDARIHAEARAKVRIEVVDL